MKLARKLLMLLLVAASASGAPPEQKTSAKGMSYHLRIPDKFAKGRHPLVFALHGAGGNGDNMMRWITGPQSTLPKESILVAPTAAKNGAWDTPDLEQLVELVKEMKSAHGTTRTYLFGFSRGGYWTFHMGTQHPELFDAAIPFAGGLPGAVPDGEAVRRLPFYVLHGEADDVVPIAESERSVKALEAAKVQVKFERIPGLKHTVDWAGLKRGLDWVDGVLDERQKALDDEVGKQVDALEKALKSKAWEEAAAGFAAIERVPARFTAKLAGLAKTHATSAEGNVALAAIAAAGRCGADGVAALKGIPGTNEKLAPAVAAALGQTGAPAAVEPLLVYLKTKSDTVATAAAEALGKLGGDAATGALVGGLSNCEALLPASPRRDAINAALRSVTGQAFTKASEWKKWLAEGGKK